jgi:hypothetical protein
MKSNHKTPLISLPQPNRHNMVNLQKIAKKELKRQKCLQGTTENSNFQAIIRYKMHITITAQVPGQNQPREN